MRNQGFIEITKDTTTEEMAEAFAKLETEEEIRKLYFELARKHHSDKVNKPQYIKKYGDEYKEKYKEAKRDATEIFKRLSCASNLARDAARAKEAGAAAAGAAAAGAAAAGAAAAGAAAAGAAAAGTAAAGAAGAGPELFSTPPKNAFQYSFKIMVHGGPQTKRTDIQKSINPEHKSSGIGADFELHNFSKSADTGITAQVWDIGGNERFQTMAKTYCKRADNIVVLFDLNNKQEYEKSVQSLRTHREAIEQGEYPDASITLIAISSGNTETKAILPAQATGAEVGEQKAYTLTDVQTLAESGEQCFEINTSSSSGNTETKAILPAQAAGAEAEEQKAYTFTDVQALAESGEQCFEINTSSPDAVKEAIETIANKLYDQLFDLSHIEKQAQQLSEGSAQKPLQLTDRDNRGPRCSLM